jgi:hypothetical protein
VSPYRVTCVMNASVSASSRAASVSDHNDDGKAVQPKGQNEGQILRLRDFVTLTIESQNSG